MDTLELRHPEGALYEFGYSDHHPAQLAALIRARRWPLITTAILLIAGMVAMFTWYPLTKGSDAWWIPGDVWEVFRSSHYVGWGYLGGVYASGGGVLTLPGFPIVLAPVAMLSGHLGLTESHAPIFLARPTAALLIQPSELLLSATVLFAADALAEDLDVSRGRRRSLCLVLATIALPVATVWGHAEDLVAMTFALCALRAAHHVKWSRCAWLLGIGISMQPLVAMMLPLVIGASPAGRRAMVAVRAALLPAVLASVAFLGDPGDTFTALIRQPAFPLVNHPTPWVALAPRIPDPISSVVHPVTFASLHGRIVVKSATSHIPHIIAVSGGAGRGIYAVGAVLIGLAAWRKPQPMERLIWLAAVVLAARCAFEAVMCPYYLAPPLILGLAMAARRGNLPFRSAVVLALGLSAYAYLRLEPWVWWLPIVGGLSAVLFLAYPPTPSDIRMRAARDEAHRHSSLRVRT